MDATRRNPANPRVELRKYNELVGDHEYTLGRLGESMKYLTDDHVVALELLDAIKAERAEVQQKMKDEDAQWLNEQEELKELKKRVIEWENKVQQAGYKVNVIKARLGLPK